MTQFENLDAVATTCGGSIGEFKGVAREIATENMTDYDTLDENKQATIMIQAKQRYMC